MSRGHGIIPYGDPSYSIQVDAMVRLGKRFLPFWMIMA